MLLVSPENLKVCVPSSSLFPLAAKATLLYNIARLFYAVASYFADQNRESCSGSATGLTVDLLLYIIQLLQCKVFNKFSQLLLLVYYICITHLYHW